MQIRYVLLLALIPGVGSGQQIGKKIFLSDKGVEVDSASSSYFKYDRLPPGLPVTSQGKEKKTDTAKTFYTSSGTLRSRTIYVNHVPNGPVTEWFGNGAVKERGAYKDGFLSGNFLTFYPNEKPHEDYLYSGTNELPYRQLINYWDSVGKPIISDGNGICNCFREEEFGSGPVRETGKVVAGLQEGDWFVYRNNELYHKEKYGQGKLIEGESYDKGQIYHYTVLAVQPEFKGGLAGMQKFIQKNVNYPKSSRRKNQEDKVFVQLIVEKDGSLSDVHVLLPKYPLLDAEAMRVVRSMPSWSPGLYRGMPVRVKFIVPINFKLL